MSSAGRLLFTEMEEGLASVFSTWKIFFLHFWIPISLLAKVYTNSKSHYCFKTFYYLEYTNELKENFPCNYLSSTIRLLIHEATLKVIQSWIFRLGNFQRGIPGLWIICCFLPCKRNPSLLQMYNIVGEPIFQMPSLNL